MIPGINLLNIAAGVIGQQTIQYRKFLSRALDDQGIWVSAFGEYFPLRSSVQRVKRTQYIQFNLEFQRNYVQVFAPFDMIDLDRDTSGDQFGYNGRLYQLESQGTWFAQDGWASCLAVDIGPFVPPVSAPPVEVPGDLDA